MGQPLEIADRRAHRRFPAGALGLSYRCRGSLRRISVPAIDFNRHGLSMFTVAPLPPHEQLYLRIEHGGGPSATVVGIVHNCVKFGEGYRCGVRFRPAPLGHHTAEETLAALARLEGHLREIVAQSR
jgi:hypothetical protein